MSAVSWQPADDGIGFIAAIGNFRLSVAPDRTVSRRGTIERAQGTKWRAFCWEVVGKGCSCRFGRDIYDDLFSSPGEAMNHAEATYKAARS